MHLFRKMERPDPGVIRGLRNLGVGFTAAGGAILTSPVALPALLMSMAGYVMITGMVVSIVCQALLKDDEDPEDGYEGALVGPGPNPLLSPDR